MNTSKQVNVMLGLLMVGLIGTLLYFIWENNPGNLLSSSRAEEAANRQLLVDAERGAALFSLNCRSCHGITGMGAIERAGLPGAPLNVDANRPTSAGELQALQSRFRGTIHCGRVGTLMPPWSIAEGGPLNDYQIEQLITLITSAASPEGWAYAIEVADGPPSHRPAGDQFDPQKFLARAAGPTDTKLALSDASGIAANDLLRIDTPADGGSYELVTVTAVGEGTNDITVKRADHNTKALDLKAGTEVFHGPILPPEGPIVGQAPAVAPCGQRSATAASPTPAGTPIPVSGTAAMNLGDNFFDVQGAHNPTLAVATGQAVTFNLTNTGTAIHNMRVAGADGKFDTADDIVSNPDTVPGGATAAIAFTPAAAGSVPYRCDFHPTEMTGTITVQ